MLSAAVVDDEGPPPQQLLTQAALLIASHQALIEDASALLYERLCLEPQSSGAVKLKTLVVLKKLVRRLSDRRRCAIVLLPWVGVGWYWYTNDWCEARCQKLSLGPSRAATACVLMTRRGGRGLRRLPSPTLRCGALWLRTPH
jgi:hypothetical protein